MPEIKDGPFDGRGINRLAECRAALARAEDEAARVLMADDFACINGSHDAAMRVVAACRAELDAAKAAEVEGVAA
jgi:hypothetical protein